MKKAAIFLLAAAALVAVALFWAYNSLDVIVKFALEHYAPDVAGVSLKVGSITLSPTDGRGSLKSVEIGNPAGFSAPRAAHLGEVAVSLDPATVRSSLVTIHEISIEAPVITYERGKSGTNLDAIQRNISSYIKRSSASPGGDIAGAIPGVRRKFVIEKLAIRGARVTMTAPGLKGQGVSFDLPDIEIHDIGRGTNGVTASEAANVVAGALISRIAQKVLTNIDLLRKGGVEGAVDALKGLFK